MLYCEYDCNIVCHKIFIMIHLLMYRLSYSEAIIHHAAINQSHCCFIIINVWIVIPVNKRELLFTLSFHFFKCLVLVMHITLWCFVSYKAILMQVVTIHLININIQYWEVYFLFLVIFSKKIFFKDLFIFGCVGSSLLCSGFL